MLVLELVEHRLRALFEVVVLLPRLREEYAHADDAGVALRIATAELVDQSVDRLELLLDEPRRFEQLDPVERLLELLGFELFGIDGVGLVRFGRLPGFDHGEPVHDRASPILELGSRRRRVQEELIEVRAVADQDDRPALLVFADEPAKRHGPLLGRAFDLGLGRRRVVLLVSGGPRARQVAQAPAGVGRGQLGLAQTDRRVLAVLRSAQMEEPRRLRVPGPGRNWPARAA